MSTTYYKKPMYKRKTYGKKLTPEQKKEVKTIISREAEHKASANNLATGSVLSTGSIVGLATVITQGVAFTQRTGDQVELKSFQFKYKAFSDQSTFGAFASTDPWNALRVIVFRWRSDTALGGNPTVADILNAGSPDQTAAVYNLDQRADYQILYDQTHSLTNAIVWNGSAAEVAPGAGCLYSSPLIKLYGKKLGAKKITFNANGTTNTGGIYLLTISDSVFSPHPQLAFNCVIEYTDS